ncbi:hypothetical protein RA280_00945 [Cupriavidus sp. CV2]|uniref:hypothetical protein n=1 Tax=Cupriavidus ulmosensis TaxID=3065913 RepID=UPI00296B3D61|nr:hypothetical protein [Cupriavidus sp. CV2]MDW3680332.1 hypothetical protein [Cupriavidus sp. CV2]
MGLWKTTGGLLWGATKLAGKAATVTTVAAAKVVTKATVATARTAYEHRDTIADVAAGTATIAAKATWETAKVAGKGAARVAEKVYNNRDVIAGATVGLVKGTVDAASDLSGHIGKDKAIAAQTALLQQQSRRYKELSENIRRRMGRKPSKAVLLDSTVVGGETLATYIAMGKVPPEIQQAYELAYPSIAAHHTLLEEVQRMDADQLQGLVAGIKGKLFELHYVEYLNAGHLPAGFHAELAHSANNPGWDIAIFGGDGTTMRDVIQLKATDSVSYVERALEQYPNIDVVTTSEVHSHLIMQGHGDHVVDGHITDHALTATVERGLDHAAGGMHWTPSVISLALIAFSAYSQEGLTNYQKSRNFGERSMKSYLAYLAGGSLAVATGTWWIGMIGGIGSRMLLGSGRAKNEKLDQLRALTKSNEFVIKKLALQAR